ncbi:aromatic ring-hydroxylating dioxygenase subunit alpha [Variovorax sp. LjRoot130]|uniref:Rieske 2Fe-2S domain-containing protein n=1 Tax=Variovorax sp. LjRoot130 TaxID=3342261 RepID=UPI003ECFCD93
MYPLEDGQLFPRNQWWVAAQSGEVGRTLLARTLLEEELVFYRKANGEPVALAGRCPHRLFPLVNGKLMGDDVACGYHGFVFGGDGRCVHIPTQDKVPTSMRVRQYPVAEHMGWVWVWMGDPTLADPALLPRPACAGPGWLFWHGITTHIKARYTLLLDNLFDLTHVAYVHASVFNFPEGEDPPGFDAPLSLRVEGDHLFAARPLCGVPYDDYATLQFGPGQGTMDLDSPSDYHGPALIVTGTVHRLHDEKAGSLAIMHPDGQRGGALRVFHGVTPETRSSTHYFSAFSRDYRLDDEAFSQQFAQIDRGIRQEDIDALEAIEPAAARATTAQEQSGLQDAAGIRVRRMLSQQIARETAVLRPGGQPRP